MFHAIIQARMGSTRLPGKVLKKYKDKTPLCILIDRLKKIEKINKIIISTTKLKKDNVFEKYCKKKKILIYKGDTHNVLKRFYKTAKTFNSKNIIRVTSDCPFIDIRTLKKMINLQIKNNYDYLANTYPLPCSFPDGSDIEIFTEETLKQTFKVAKLPSEKEHVTKYMWASKKFRIFRLKSKINLSKYRYTVDILEDFKLFCFILDSFPRKDFYKIGMMKIINLIKKNPFEVEYQKNIKRNFGWNNSIKKDLKYLND